MIRIYCKQASKLVVEEALLLWLMKRSVMILMTSRRDDRDDDDHDLDDVKKEIHCQSHVVSGFQDYRDWWW